MLPGVTICYQVKLPQKLTRDNTQLLFNHLFSLPSSVVEKVKCVQLPAPTTRIPREKPLPKPKLPTKWEAFAKSKGEYCVLIGWFETRGVSTVF